MENLIMSRRLYSSIFNTWKNVKVTTKEGDVYQSDIRLKCCTYTCDDGTSNNVYLDDIKKPDWGNYFDLRKGETSYHSGVQTVNENGQWIREGRQICKISKLLTYITGQHYCGISYYEYIPDDIKPKMVKRLIEILSTETKITGSEILISDDVASVYSIPTAYENTGTLGNSCMRPESDYSCHDQVGFYNAMGACIAYTLDKDGRLTSRALLWKDCRTSDNVVFSYIDRIYGNELAIAEMKEWAHENGFAHKQAQSHSDSTLIKPDGSKFWDFRYSKKTTWFYGFPYVDTMKYFKEEDGIITISSNDYGFRYELSCTDGSDPRQCEEEEVYEEEEEEV